MRIPVRFIIVNHRRLLLKAIHIAVGQRKIEDTQSNTCFLIKARLFFRVDIRILFLIQVEGRKRMRSENVIPICLLLLLYFDAASPTHVFSQMKSNCSMRYFQLKVKHKNCLPVRVSARACSGTCASYTTVSAINPSHLETKCDCCQYVGRKRKRFGIKCPHSTKKNYYKLAVVSMTMPKRCMCRPCSTTPSTVMSAEQSILRTSPILSDSLKATLRQLFLFLK